MDRLREFGGNTMIRLQNFSLNDEKVNRLVTIGLLAIGAIVVIGYMVCSAYIFQNNIDLTLSLSVAEERVKVAEQNLHNAKQELQTANEENVALNKTIGELSLEIQELRNKLSKKDEEERKQQILSDPNAKIVDLIQYMTGDFEENVEKMAHMLIGETRGSGYKYKELHVLMAVARAFDSRLSNGTGDLESVIFKEGQFGCVYDKSYYQTPDEDCYNVARQVLSGNVLYYQDICRNDLLFTKNIDAICEPMEE